MTYVDKTDPTHIRSTKLDEGRVRMNQMRTPAYADALRLCRVLEAELAAAKAGRTQAS